MQIYNLLLKSNIGLLVCFILLSILTIKSVTCERKDIHHMMYETFDKGAMCFRILNGTNQFGCSTSRTGQTGVVHFVNNEADIHWLLEDAKAGPYMAVIRPSLFTKAVMRKFVGSSHVSGILLAMNDSRPQSMSPDDTCPNRYSSLSSSCDDNAPWNPVGSGFLQLDWPVPLYVVKESDMLLKVYDCFAKFNLPLEKQTERPLCSLQMNGHMYAAVDTPTCLRRNDLANSFTPVNFCDPMGDQNIVSQQFPGLAYNKSSVVMVTARLDAAGMFDGLAPGGVTTVTALVTLLTTAHVLSLLLPQHKDTYSKNIVFALLNGEAQDYIGSSRVVYDMQNGTFLSTDAPLRLEHLDQVIDLNQLDATKKLYAHCYQSSAAKSTIHLLTTAGSQFNVSVDGSCSSGKLPPSSLHSFLKASSSLPGIILTNHASQYTNKYYNGLLDDSVNLNFEYYNSSNIPVNSVQNSLASVAQSLALTLARLVDPDISWPTTIDSNHITAKVDQMLYCYLQTKQCQLFKNVTDAALLGNAPYPFYVGVVRSPNLVTRLTRRILALLTGTVVSKPEDKCWNKQGTTDTVDSTYEWIQNQCYKTSIVLTPAVSPAFIIDNYDWASGEYPSWTESVWTDLRVRMFLRPSFSQELTALVSGLVVLLLSFGSVYWFNKNSDQLFNPLRCENC